MSLSKGICQQNMNHCFDSIELKKISYIIFERDYYKSLSFEQEHENNLLKNKINNFSYIDSLRVENINTKDSIITEKEKVILSEVQNNKNLKKENKRNKVLIKVISVVGLILIILK